MLGSANNSNKIIKVVLAFLILLLSLSPKIAYAGDVEREDISYESMNKTGSALTSRPIEFEQIAQADLSGLSEDVERIGIDSAFGLSTRGYAYHGEVPNPDSTVEELKDYPHTTVGRIYDSSLNDYVSRTWWSNPTDINDGLKWEDSSTKDIHALNLTKDYNMFEPVSSALKAFAFNLIAAINSIFNAIVKFEIELSNFDIYSVLDAIGLDKLSEILNNLFISNGGGPSPVMVIAIVLFILGLIPLLFRRVKGGDVSVGAILTEFGYLIIAMLVAAVALSGGLPSITTTMSNFSTKAISGLSTVTSGDEGGVLKLYEYSTGNEANDANKTQGAISNKPFIDFMIKNQFGYSVDDLYLRHEDWGLNSDDDLRKIISSLTDKEGDKLFAVSTEKDGNAMTMEGIGGENPINLGYYWYAACTNVDVHNPYSSNGNGKLKSNEKAFQSRYIVDFLAAVDAETGGSSKARHIMDQMNDLSYDIVDYFPVMLVSILLSLALLVSVGMTLFGKLFFDVGILGVSILPVLMLTPIGEIRNIAKKFVFSWLLSLIKMIIGMTMVLLTLTFSAILCSVDFGVWVDIIFLFFMFRFAPKLFVKINNTLDNSVGQNQLSSMRSLDQKFNGGMERLSSNMGFLENRRSETERRSRLSQRLRSDMESQSRDANSNMEDIRRSVENSAQEAYNNYATDGGSSETQSDQQSNVISAFESEPLDDKDFEKIGKAKEEAEERLRELRNERDSDIAERLGIANEEFNEAVDKVDELQRETKERRAREVRKELDFLNSKAGTLLTLIPGVSTIIDARRTARDNELIRNILPSERKLQRDLNKAMVDLHSQFNNREFTEEQKKNIEAIGLGSMIGTSNLGQILSVARKNEETEILDDLDKKVFKISKHIKDEPRVIHDPNILTPKFNRVDDNVVSADNDIPNVGGNYTGEGNNRSNHVESNSGVQQRQRNRNNSNENVDNNNKPNQNSSNSGSGNKAPSNEKKNKENSNPDSSPFNFNQNQQQNSNESRFRATRTKDNGVDSSMRDSESRRNAIEERQKQKQESKTPSESSSTQVESSNDDGGVSRRRHNRRSRRQEDPNNLNGGGDIIS